MKETRVSNREAEANSDDNQFGNDGMSTLGRAWCGAGNLVNKLTSRPLKFLGRHKKKALLIGALALAGLGYSINHTYTQAMEQLFPGGAISPHPSRSHVLASYYRYNGNSTERVLVSCYPTGRGSVEVDSISVEVTDTGNIPRAMLKLAKNQLSSLGVIKDDNTPNFRGAVKRYELLKGDSTFRFYEADFINRFGSERDFRKQCQIAQDYKDL